MTPLWTLDDAALNAYALEDEAPFALEDAPYTTTKERTGRSTRISIRPSRYGMSKDSAIPDGPILTQAEQTQKQMNEITHQQVKQNEEFIKQTARNHCCPLLCLKMGVDYPPKTDSLNVLLSTQMRQPALASDGCQYDLTELTKYIQARMHQRLVSPITKQPMGGEVQYVTKHRDAKDKNRVRWKQMTWQPSLSGSD